MPGGFNPNAAYQQVGTDTGQVIYLQNGTFFDINGNVVSPIVTVPPGAGFPQYPAATFATLPGAAQAAGQTYLVTDVGGANGSLWRSNGVVWLPASGIVTLLKSCASVGVAPTGTMANNGAITLGTAIPASSVGGLYWLLPAGAMENATVTFTPASPTVNWAAHGLPAGTAVSFTNSGGGLPASITPGTTYYVSSAGLAAGTFQIAAALSDALAGLNSIVFATAGTGTQTGATAQALYWTVMSDTTHGQVFNNTYSGTGLPVPPASPTPFVTTHAGAYTGLVTANQINGIVVPGKAMGPNGQLRMSGACVVSNNANAKTVSVRLGGTLLMSGTNVSVANSGFTGLIANNNSNGSQDGNLLSAFNFGGVSANPSASIDTTANQTVGLFAQLAAATDFVIHTKFVVELLSDGA